MIITSLFLSRVVLAISRFLNKLLGPNRRRPIIQEFRLFFGLYWDRLQTHEKHYPGYDLASVNRALASFHEECCTEVKELGSCGANTMYALFEMLKQPYFRNRKPESFSYHRVPINVDEENSVVAHGLYLEVVRPETGGASNKERKSRHSSEDPLPGDPDRIAVLLTTNTASQGYWTGMETNHVFPQQVTVSIACRSREVADRFFAEIEERRKRLSVYQGKVIDPVLQGGIVYTIGFRTIKQVREEDLILPDSVKQLIRNSVVGFYNHRDVLEQLGIEMKRGILLYGPPGTGKTSISLYLAGLLPSFTVCFVSGERLLYPREVCRMARYLQPAMVVFEDIDLIAMERDANGLATVLGELMNQIDGCEPTDQVLFLMNTNSLDRLESAVRNRPGRVDQIIEIPLPDRDARRQLLAHFARNLTLQTEDLDAVLDATEEMSPAMLKEIVKRSAVSAIEHNGSSAGKELALTEADLLLAAEQVRVMRDPIVFPGTLGFREKRS